MAVRESVAVQRATARREGRLALLLSGVLLLGLFVRLSFVLAADFPLSDGGLFYAMVRDLQQAHYRLPVYASYNSAALPFAYPPLPFYLAAALDDLLPCGLLAIFRFLPLLANLLTMVSFCFLSRTLLSSDGGVFYAGLAFALLPRSFQWQIMGGGLTRSLGLLFAVLGIHQIYLMYTRGGRLHLVAATFASAATVLSHLEMAWFLAISALFFFLACGRSRRGLALSLWVAGGTLALTAPWWAVIVARHGLEPFVAANQRSWPLYNGLLQLVTLQISGERFFPILAALGLLGALTCLGQRRWLLPGWLVWILALDHRSPLTPATLPLALLAGIGVNELLLPALAGRSGPTSEPSVQVRVAASDAGSAAEAGRDPQDPPGGGPTLAPALNTAGGLGAVVLAFIALYAVCSAVIGDRSYMAALSPEERQAMDWVAAHTPPTSTFAVVTGDEAWGTDRSSEWFPTLTRRVSVATVQGHEWAPGFAEQIERYRALQRCATHNGDCLESWLRRTGSAIGYLYVVKRAPSFGESAAGADGCLPLREALSTDARYRLLYDGPGAAVYGRVNPGTP